MLRDRRGLHGECGLIHGQPARAEQPNISGHEISRAEPDHIARHQLRDRQPTGRGRRLRAGAAKYGRGRRHQLPQRRHRPVGPVLLRGAQQAADHHEHQNHRCGAPRADRGGDQTQTEQNRGERVPQAADEALRPGDRTPGRKCVVAEPPEPFLGLCLQKSARSAVQRTQHLQRRQFGPALPLSRRWRCDRRARRRYGDGRGTTIEIAADGPCGRAALRHRAHAGVPAAPESARPVRRVGRPSAVPPSLHQDRRPGTPGGGLRAASVRDQRVSALSDAG